MENQTGWPDQLFDVLKRAEVRQVGYVPDAGHARLIARCKADNDIRDVVLSTEEEGVALAAGAWLGGQRSALLMQSSGVGNCINMLSLINTCRFPFLTFITMRGEWAEFNPWQVPMSQATEPVLTAMGVKVYRANEPDEVADTARLHQQRRALPAEPRAGRERDAFFFGGEHHIADAVVGLAARDQPRMAGIRHVADLADVGAFEHIEKLVRPADLVFHGQRPSLSLTSRSSPESSADSAAGIA